MAKNIVIVVLAVVTLMSLLYGFTQSTEAAIQRSHVDKAQEEIIKQKAIVSDLEKRLEEQRQLIESIQKTK
ncbi:MAG: hypothetical protein JST14_02675 [Bacteroidetes bacterium]|nr:hypothetical protein [Bacteroidota bacterium]